MNHHEKEIIQALEEQRTRTDELVRQGVEKKTASTQAYNELMQRRFETWRRRRERWARHNQR